MTPAGELRSPFASAPGGVMTEEAGAITGDLELSTTLGNGALSARVRYAGADEWYAVVGSPTPVPGGDPRGDPHGTTHEALHEAARRALTRPAPTARGNEAPASLEGTLPP